MIRILCQEGFDAIGEEISHALRTRYDPQPPPVVLADTAVWSGPATWDDVLLVAYGPPTLAPQAQRFIHQYRAAHALTDPQTKQHRPGGVVIPVATDPAWQRPPEPITGLKALLYDDAARGPQGRLAEWVGVFLGLLLRPGEHQIFISYRAADGREIAEDLFARLSAAGFHPWLDEAPDRLPPGSAVQQIIEAQLKHAGLVLVVDTPDAPESRWIKLEIDAAIAEMVLVLPVVVGEEGSRFISLSSLRRRVPVKPSGVDRQPLTDADWEAVLRKIEALLLEAHGRRLRTTARAEAVFRQHGYDWMPIDGGRLIYRSRRDRTRLPAEHVLSHCSVLDVTWMPALQAYTRFLTLGYPDIAHVNQKLYIYDRDRVLADAEIQTIAEQLDGLPFILAHHEELPILLASQFSTLRELPR